jgi:hypothetical protein
MIELITIKLEKICDSMYDEIMMYVNSEGSQRKLSIAIGEDENYINNSLHRIQEKTPINRIKTLFSILKKIEKKR